MKAPEVWRAFHDAFAALPADFLATVTMSSIFVDGDIVNLHLRVEQDGKGWEVSRVEDVRMLKHSRLPVDNIAVIAWDIMLRQLGCQFPAPPFEPVPMPDFLKRLGGPSTAHGTQGGAAGADADRGHL